MEYIYTNMLIILVLMIFIYLTFKFYIKLRFFKRNGLTLKEEHDAILEEISNNEMLKTSIINDLDEKRKELEQLLILEKREKEIESNLKHSNDIYAKLSLEIDDLEKAKSEIENSLKETKKELSIFEPKLDLVNLGFFEEPDYLFDTSERFKAEILAIREEQKFNIMHQQAILIPDTIALSKDERHVKKVLNGQSKLMLKAFNLECDYLMSLVKPSNYAKILERIEKASIELEKTTASLKCTFDNEYVKLKFKECELQYQFKLKDAREKEEQLIIREQIREEEKARREYEKALEKAKREETLYQNALVTARNELEIASESNKSKLQDKISFLEIQLNEAIENGKRAKSMAEQTRRGHVYIISNIGSFGENIYKIGLTRRLEPIERVNELGGASVPFPFDVHAMIYNKDAPSLETTLHRAFTSRRVNMTNYRKEFFKVSLIEIQNKAIEITGSEIEFKVTAVAADYYESEKLRQEIV